MSPTTLSRITPVLFVERIEASADFWQRCLGFMRTIEVPGENGLGFAAFSDGNLEVMYQTYASGAEDVAALADAQRQGPTFLFVQVADLDAVEAALQDFEIVMPRRTTFYGATEIGYREPGGHIVTFAQFAETTG